MQNTLIHFPEPVAVQAEDMDELQHVNNIVYLKWVQDAAVSHWNHAAPPDIKAEYVWVVIRHEIDYKQPALRGDIIQAKTWVVDTQGATSNRMVELYRQSDMKLLAVAKTTWCLLMRQNFRPMRISPEVRSIFITD